jgi:3-oxoacyl-[acyl-carrier protein] reductase
MPSRKVAIISGGCGGIGKVIGKKLSEDGFDVVLLCFGTPVKDDEAILKSFSPGDHEILASDLRNASATKELIEAQLKKRGAIDACVHAAVSPIIRKAIMELGIEELEQQCEVGLFGGFNFLKPIAAAMQAKHSGTMIGLLSRATVLPEASRGRMAGYVVAKEGLRSLLREFYRELSPSSVTVNAIAPAFMDTPLNGDIPAQVREFILTRLPEEKENPLDVAETTSFLCSPKGKRVNGKIFSPAQKEIAIL